MSDNYQAVYDAVRSRIGHINLHGVVEDTIRSSFDISNAVHIITSEIRGAVYDWQESGRAASRPSVLFRPTLSLDGNQWCALLGDNLHDGLAAFGDTPDAAMRAFDAAWTAPLPAPHPDAVQK